MDEYTPCKREGWSNMLLIVFIRYFEACFELFLHLVIFLCGSVLSVLFFTPFPTMYSDPLSEIDSPISPNASILIFLYVMVGFSRPWEGSNSSFSFIIFTLVKEL